MFSSTVSNWGPCMMRKYIFYSIEKVFLMLEIIKYLV